MPRLRRGSGSLYRQPGSSMWWVSYYVAGRRVRESTGTRNRAKAREFLDRRLGQRADGKLPGAGTLTFEDLAALVVADYKANNRRTLDDAETRLENLAEHFSGMAAKAITTDDVTAYQARRRAAGVANSTINRETDMLSKGFNLAMRAGKLTAKPYVPKLTEPDARAGFFEPSHLATILPHLPDFMRPPVRFAYETGWRLRSEVVPLTWDRVDLAHGTVRLDPGQSKTGEPRTFPITAELRAILEAQQAERCEGVPWVFPGRDGMGRITHPEYYWGVARKAAGLPEKLMHDLRRTAVRSMRRAGVSEQVAMKLTGHKTRSVFDRYGIVSDRDLRDAAALLDTARTVIVSGIVGRRKKRASRVST